MESHKNIFVLNLLLFLTFDLMLLGAGVRTMDAGLTCPDWPLCFGKIIPKYHFGVYLEFIHRVIAGLVGLIYLYFFVQVLRKKSLNKVRILSFVGLFFLVAQIIMGGLTVLKLLEAYIVTMHLGLATVFLLTLYWMKKSLEVKRNLLSPEIKSKRKTLFKLLVLVSLVGIVIQIILGGMVASTYSGLVCIDFPTCNGQYFPTMVGPIGIQMLHRFGAYFLSLIILLLFILALFNAKEVGIDKKNKMRVIQIFFIVGTQVFVGVMNLKFLMPAYLSVFHLALALILLLKITDLRFQITTKDEKLTWVRQADCQGEPSEMLLVSNTPH